MEKGGNISQGDRLYGVEWGRERFYNLYNLSSRFFYLSLSVLLMVSVEPFRYEQWKCNFPVTLEQPTDKTTNQQTGMHGGS